MTSAAEKLWQEYQDKLNKLRVACQHLNRTDWLYVSWAPGHYSVTSQVKECMECKEVVERRRMCHVCQKWLTPEEWVEAEGKVLALGPVYCKPCFRSAYNHILPEVQKRHRRWVLEGNAHMSEAWKQEHLAQMPQPLGDS